MNRSMRRWQVLGIAIAVDLLLGEPPVRLHPVVWMGRAVALFERSAPSSGRAAMLAYGAGAEVALLALVGAPALLLERLARRLGIVGALLLALALKPAFAARSLFQFVREVERPLSSGDLGAARAAVGHIVSRDVRSLDEPRVAAAAIESLAENASDSVVAPLLYYSVLGLPGAYVYRMANTLDASWGYRGRYEYLGKIAARLDDLLNLMPSRLTAASIAVACRAAGGSPPGAIRSALCDSALTASPNAGWPMASVAGALDVRLEKLGHYTINPAGRLPGPEDVRRAQPVVAAGVAAATLALLALSRRLQVD